MGKNEYRVGKTEEYGEPGLCYVKLLGRGKTAARQRDIRGIRIERKGRYRVPTPIGIGPPRGSVV